MKRHAAHIRCNIIVSSEKVPIIIKENAEKNPAICVQIVNLLFRLLPIYHSYNPIKNGKSKKPAIIHPKSKKIAPFGFILVFPRLLIQFTNGLYNPSKLAIEINIIIQYTEMTSAPNTKLIGHLLGIGNFS